MLGFKSKTRLLRVHLKSAQSTYSLPVTRSNYAIGFMFLLLKLGNAMESHHGTMWPSVEGWGSFMSVLCVHN